NTLRYSQGIAIAPRRGAGLSEETETLRWPTNLDHAAIVKRLVQIRKQAREAGLDEIASRFEGVEAMFSGQIGARVVAALTWIQEKPEYAALAKQLGMIAVNLKNLK